MEINFSTISDLNSGSTPPNLSLTISDTAISPTLARIRLNFKTDIPLGTTLELLDNTFTATQETKLPYGFEANSPALGLQLLLGYYPTFNGYDTIPESTHSLLIIAKDYGNCYLPNITQIASSEAIEQVEVLEEGTSINPYFNLVNKLHLHFNTGLTYSAAQSWLSFKKSHYQKLLPLTAHGVHQLPSLSPSENIPFTKVPQNGLVRYPLSAMQIDAYLQQTGGEITKIATSDVLLFVPNAPLDVLPENLLPSSTQIGSPLNGGEGQVLVQGAGAIPLYFIVPNQPERYINPTATISLVLEIVEGNTTLSTNTITIGTIANAGLYCYWLLPSDFSNPNAQLQVKVMASSQTLYQGIAWTFTLLSNENPILCLGYLNEFGLPTFLNLPIANTNFEGNRKTIISAPISISKKAIEQWQNSPEKWIITNGNIVLNTIKSIRYKESTDNQLTLILATDEQ